MKFAQAQRIADTVLYEGYLLYPYRGTSLKNRFRWQFGVVVPPGYHATNEPSQTRAEFMLRAGGGCRLDLQVRFLKVVPRPADGWEEGIEHSLDFAAIPPTELPLSFPIEGAGLSGMLHVSAEPVGALLRLRVIIENTTLGKFHSRAEAVRHSFVGLHTLVGVENGEFLSLADPPAEATEACAGCRNLETWPVMIGRQTVLCSPIILEDQPQIAPESPGDFYDATEIDEMLTLRVMSLTDEEKAEARATDPRAREIIERADQLDPDWQERLHGAVRKLEPTGVTVGGVRIEKDSRVRLNPSRRADAHDMFLKGRAARVAAVHRDLDGQVYLSVTIEDDPGADLHDWYGRYYYFHPEEVEPL